MKQAKKPTYKQKQLLSSHKLDVKEWLVEFEISNKLGLVKKDGSVRKVLEVNV